MMFGSVTATKSPRVSLCCCVFFFVSLNAAFADPAVRISVGPAEKCLVTQGQTEAIPLAPIALAFGSSIIRSSVSAIGRYLTNAAQSTSTPVLMAVGDSELFRITRDGNGIKVEPNLECLVVVTGTFGEIAPQGIPTNYAQLVDPDALFVKVRDGKTDAAILRTLGLADVPNSYFEFKFDRHPTSEAFRLTPQIVYFRAANTARNTQSPKNIEITVTITKPSPTGALDIRKSTEENGLVAQAPIVMKQIVPGRLRRAGNVQYDTVWVTTPKPPSEDEVKKGTEKIVPNTTVRISPANVFVTYRESDQPDLMFSILASIVSDNSDRIGSGLEEALRALQSNTSK